LQERIPAQEQAQDSGPKILSKKEKEKLKKEREKVWQVLGTLYELLNAFLSLGKKESPGCSQKNGGND